MNLVVNLIFVTFFGQILAEKNFVVNVISYSGSDFNSSTLLCYGTILSSRHVLAPASCIDTSRNIGVAAITLTGTNFTTSYGKERKLKNRKVDY